MWPSTPPDLARTVDRKRFDREWIDRILRDVVAATPFGIVASMEEIKTRVRMAVEAWIGHELARRDVGSLINSIERFAPLATGVFKVRWRPSGSGKEWHALALSERYRGVPQVRAVLNQFFARAMVADRDRLGLGYEEWVTSTLQADGHEVYRFSQIFSGSGPLSRAGDLVVAVDTTEGRGLIVVECRVARAETCHIVGAAELNHAEAFAAAGCAYVMLHPDFSAHAFATLENYGIAGATGSYFINDPMRHAYLREVGVPRPMTLMPDPPLESAS